MTPALALTAMQTQSLVPNQAWARRCVGRRRWADGQAEAAGGAVSGGGSVAPDRAVWDRAVAVWHRTGRCRTRRWQCGTGQGGVGPGGWRCQTGGGRLGGWVSCSAAGRRGTRAYGR